MNYSNPKIHIRIASVELYTVRATEGSIWVPPNRHRRRSRVDQLRGSQRNSPISSGEPLISPSDGAVGLPSKLRGRTP
ncbi:hypothetical protein N7468_010271 [Penicillium chermesinum]|uniref:Uncharacterized protein n=1 Tax=Penicillium chermesinum TaxID=63820 RepID=A0A9W9TC43_9EURO|nr:uncharacterized protein N7468_010271 [Penicillium chermesinum]KAJ5217263.1 hypothetical protein N7468_010271 [Penicillium chermesinum]